MVLFHTCVVNRVVESCTTSHIRGLKRQLSAATDNSVSKSSHVRTSTVVIFSKFSTWQKWQVAHIFPQNHSFLTSNYNLVLSKLCSDVSISTIGKQVHKVYQLHSPTCLPISALGYAENDGCSKF